MARIHCLSQNAAVGGSECCPRMEFPCSAVRAPLSRTTSDRRVLTKTGPSRRAGASALHMISVARQVWPSAGGDHLDNAAGRRARWAACGRILPRKPRFRYSSVRRDFRSFVGLIKLCGLLPASAKGGVRNGNGPSLSRTVSTRITHAEWWAFWSGEVAGVSQQPEEPEVRRRGGECAKIFRSLQRGGSPRCPGHGKREWALGGR